jgi:GntR family transcriptional regulator
MPVTADYARIAQDIETSIRSGAREPTSKLPTLLELKKQYGVSDTTIKYALVWLESRKLIYRHQGKGIYVAQANTWLIDPQA